MSLFQPQNNRVTSPASDTPPSENALVAPKSLRPARPTKATNFQPVDINGKNWAKLEDHEAQLAAYLGFQNTSDLREFAISWPTLLAEKYFAPAAQKMTKIGTFKFLSNPGSIGEIAAVAVDSSPDLVWTWQSGDPPHHQTIQKRKIVAWTLRKMVLNIKQYKETSVAENLSRTQIEQAEFLKRHASNRLGRVISFPETMDNFPCPELGPLTDKGENELESYNRCWEVLRYLGSGFHKGNWKRRFTNTEVMKSGRTVNTSHAPPWMQTVTQPVLPDPLRAIEVEILWVHNEDVAMYHATALAIEEAKSKQAAVPDSQFTFPWDPRVFPNAEQFRDNVRRCLNCEALGLDLQSIWVHCYDGDEDRHEQADAFTEDWAMLKAFFENPYYSKFFVAVRLQPFYLDDPLSLYEDGGVPIDPLLYLATPNSEIIVERETADNNN
ncbi:hypothetical protein ACN42_g11759 [Penicillium freii]|uniref:Uncharacterized protein n=1 Tax=Penicillium freii TaxID=48697 RepID=A0A117NK40_PENFR|nr:hypothetical protein ACN42_g11759 [Penicillium freii]